MMSSKFVMTSSFLSTVIFQIGYIIFRGLFMIWEKLMYSYIALVRGIKLKVVKETLKIQLRLC